MTATRDDVVDPTRWYTRDALVDLFGWGDDVILRMRLSGIVRPAGGGPARPWASRGGLSNDELRQAFRTRDRHVLTGLYFAGVHASPAWWGDCEAFRVRFLACVHHAVTRATTSAMGLLSQLVRANLRDRSADDADQLRRYRLAGARMCELQTADEEGARSYA